MQEQSCHENVQSMGTGVVGVVGAAATPYLNDS